MAASTDISRPLGSARPAPAQLTRPRPRANPYAAAPARPTDIGERILLFLIIIALPLQDQFVPMQGLSLAFILFGLTATYTIFFRVKVFLVTLAQPAFVAAYVFLLIAFIAEASHPEANYHFLTRTALMVLGAIIIAMICRDARALNVALAGYLVSAFAISTFLFGTVYGGLKSASAANFNEASNIREQLFADSGFDLNLNIMAFLAAQGALVALSLLLYSNRRSHRILLAGVLLSCLVGAFLPMSRSGAGLVVISFILLLRAHGRLRMRTIFIMGASAAAVLYAVPQVIFSRMSFTTETQQGRVEGRAMVYMASLEHFFDSPIDGVGAGNFWGNWGFLNGFYSHDGVVGTHNCFFQVAICWGIFSLLAFIVLVYMLYRCRPQVKQHTAKSLCLVGIGISSAMLIMTTHNLYAKELSLAMGLLVGSRKWAAQIFPKTKK